MKKFKAVFLRKFPSLEYSYEVSQTIEAENIQEARKKASVTIDSTVFGSMKLLKITEQRPIKV